MGSEENLGDAVYLVAPVVLSAVAAMIPIENFLSEFPFEHVFPWYPPWRGALVSFLIWIAAGLVLSERRRWTKLLFIGSAASFVVYHYFSLVETALSGHPVALYPLFYVIGEGPLHVDLAQVVVILTLYALKKDLVELARKIGVKAT